MPSSKAAAQGPSLVVQPRRIVTNGESHQVRRGKPSPDPKTCGVRVSNAIRLIDRISFGVVLLGSTNPDGAWTIFNSHTRQPSSQSGVK
jgi:hypothetical protein